MPGRLCRSFCPTCRGRCGPDCTEAAHSPRQIRLQLKRELARAVQEALERRAD